MGYTKINTFAGATSAEASLTADTNALRTAVNAVASSDIDADSVSERHFVDPKPVVYHKVVEGPLVSLGWERRGYGEHMFAVVRKTDQCWSGEIAKIRNRRSYFVRSLPVPREVIIASVGYIDGLTPIVSKRVRLGDRGNVVFKVFASWAHILLQQYTGANTPTVGYPGLSGEASAGYFMLAYKSATATAWQRIDGTKRHVWPGDSAYNSYKAVCDYNVSTIVDLSLSEGGDYDIALCYFRDTTTGPEQLIVGPTSLMITTYHKA